MTSPETTKITKLLEPILRRNKVSKAILFGSAARGSSTRRSDLDLLIVMESDKRFFDRYEEFSEIHDLLKGTAVDMLLYTPQEMERISHRPFIRKILSEGKVIYEQ